MKHSPASTVIGHDVGYRYPDGTVLFSNLEFAFGPGRHGLVGPPDSGVPILARLISGDLSPTEGSLTWTVPPEKRLLLTGPPHAPPAESVADELGIGPKLEALRKLQAGSADPEVFDLLTDAWDVEERGQKILERAGLSHLDLDASAEELDPDQRMKVHLARIRLESPELLVFDEPVEMLSDATRRLVRKALTSFNGTLIIVGSDRYLLDSVDQVWELSERGLKLYGGNFSFYMHCRQAEIAAAEDKLARAQHELERRRALAEDALARQAHRIDHGRKFADTGLPKVHRGNMKRRSQETMAKVAHRHEELVKEAERRVESALETRRLVDSPHLEPHS